MNLETLILDRILELDDLSIPFEDITHQFEGVGRCLQRTENELIFVFVKKESGLPVKALFALKAHQQDFARVFAGGIFYIYYQNTQLHSLMTLPTLKKEGNTNCDIVINITKSGQKVLLQQLSETHTTVAGIPLWRILPICMLKDLFYIDHDTQEPPTLKLNIKCQSYPLCSVMGYVRNISPYSGGHALTLTGLNTNYLILVNMPQELLPDNGEALLNELIVLENAACMPSGVFQVDASHLSNIIIITDKKKEKESQFYRFINPEEGLMGRLFLEKQPAIQRFYNVQKEKAISFENSVIQHYEKDVLIYKQTFSPSPFLNALTICPQRCLTTYFVPGMMSAVPISTIAALCKFFTKLPFATVAQIISTKFLIWGLVIGRAALSEKNPGYVNQCNYQEEWKAKYKSLKEFGMEIPVNSNIPAFIPADCFGEVEQLENEQGVWICKRCKRKSTPKKVPNIFIKVADYGCSVWLKVVGEHAYQLFEVSRQTVDATFLMPLNTDPAPAFPSDPMNNRFLFEVSIRRPLPAEVSPNNNNNINNNNINEKELGPYLVVNQIYNKKHPTFQKFLELQTAVALQHMERNIEHY